MSSRSARALAAAAAGSVMLSLAPAAAQTAATTVTTQSVTDAKAALAEAKQAVQSQQAKVAAAQAALDQKVEARNVAKRALAALGPDAADEERAAYELALADATDAVNDANIDAETERVELSVRKQAVEDAREELRRATVALAKAQADKPEETDAPETPTAGDGTGQAGSSAAGTAVAVALGVLAALGTGVALAPRLGIDLSQYGIRLP